MFKKIPSNFVEMMGFGGGGVGNRIRVLFIMTISDYTFI